MRKIVTGLCALALVAAGVLLFASAAMASGHKTDVCHKGRIINVATASVPAHEAHGDNVVGPEVCDGVDNDCDGVVDEDLTQGTTCGEGACAAEGTETCTAGVWGDNTCTEGEPTEEVCDEVDNDCNGIPDDGADCGRLVTCRCPNPPRSFTDCVETDADCLESELVCRNFCGAVVEVFRCDPIGSCQLLPN